MRRVTARKTPLPLSDPEKTSDKALQEREDEATLHWGYKRASDRTKRAPNTSERSSHIRQAFVITERFTEN